MSDPIATYDAKKVSVTVAGVPLTGLAEDSFVKIERSADSFSSKAGSRGEVERSRHQDRRAKVTLKLLQTSMSNTYLSALAFADERGLTGQLGPWALEVKDIASGSKYHADQAWLVKPAAAEFSKETAEREWTFECADISPVQNLGVPNSLSALPGVVAVALPDVASGIEAAIAAAGNH